MIHDPPQEQQTIGGYSESCLSQLKVQLSGIRPDTSMISGRIPDN